MLFFFIWMLHGSTKVVVPAVALLSANTKNTVALRKRMLVLRWLSPGRGHFANCPDPTSGDPMIVTWLASFTRCPPSVPSLFPDMLTCLSPGDRHIMPGIFATTLQLMEPLLFLLALVLNSISTLPFSPHLSSAQLPSSNFLSPPWRRSFITILPSF